jgi:hypothetical protein
MEGKTHANCDEEGISKNEFAKNWSFENLRITKYELLNLIGVNFTN